MKSETLEIVHDDNIIYEELFINISQEKHIKTLTLIDYPYDDIPESFLRMTNITTLGFKNVKWITVPAIIGYFKNMIELNIAGELIETLPNEFKYLTEVKLLTIASDNIREFPKIIGKMRKLRKLIIEAYSSDILSNSILPLNYELVKNKNLKSIYLLSNDIDNNIINELIIHAPNVKVLRTKDQYNIKTLPSEEWKDNMSRKVLSCCNYAIFYTYIWNDILNSYMRKELLPRFLVPLYKSLTYAKDYSPEGVPLYRGINSKYLGDIVEGNIIYDNGFTSLTFDIDVAMSFADHTDPCILVQESPIEGTYLN